MSQSSVEDAIRQWNVKYPYDRWWRQKHNIAFGSKHHLEVCALDIVFEYFEDKLFKQLIKDDKKPVLTSYNRGEGSFLLPQRRFVEDDDHSLYDDINTLDDLFKSSKIKIDG